MRCRPALAIIQAHKALEDLCLERDVLHMKLGLEQTWADQVYNGRWFSPLKQALDAFMGATQAQLTGEVKLKLYKGSCVVVGRKSAAALYDQALATYDNDDAFDQKAAKGFIDIQALLHQDLGHEAGTARAGKGRGERERAGAVRRRRGRCHGARGRPGGGALARQPRYEDNHLAERGQHVRHGYRYREGAGDSLLAQGVDGAGRQGAARPRRGARVRGARADGARDGLHRQGVDACVAGPFAHAARLGLM